MSSRLEIEFDPQARPHTASLALDGVASYREAAELRTALFEAIERARGGNLVVELRELDHVDTAAMAVLIEGLLATRDAGPNVYLIHSNESVRRVFELAGFEDALMRCFGCWDDLPESLAAGTG